MQPVDSKKVRAEIAANGFAEAVERHGFRKVGATHWRRDNDEVTWRVALVPTSYKPAPESFLAVMGGLIHGLDDLAKTVDGNPVSDRIDGLSARAHIHREVGFNLYGDYHKGEWEPFADDLPEPIRHPERLRRKYQGRQVWGLPEGLQLFDSGQVVKYWGKLSVTSSVNAFSTEGRNVGDVARAVSCYFDTFFAPLIERWMLFNNIYADFYGPDAPNFWPYRELENLCAAKLAGDINHFRDLVRPKITEAIRSDDDMREELLADRLIQERLQDDPELTVSQIIEKRRAVAIRVAKQYLRFCEKLNVAPPVPQI